MNEALRDKIGGVIFGTAIGDALGYPVEFVPVHDRIQNFPDGIKSYTRFVKGKALYSDDTQMMRAILEGLLREPSRSDFQKSTEEVAEELVAWSKSPENNRAPGNACMSGCAALASGKDWRFCGSPEAMGSGAAMRAMAYSVWFPDYPNEAGRWAALHSRMTHGHPGAQEAAYLTARAVCLLMSGITGGRLWAELFSFAGCYDMDTAMVVSEAVKIARNKTQKTEDILAELDGKTSPSAIAAALVCLVRGKGDFQKSVSLGVTHCSDADTVGAITGALVGGLVGFKNLPENLVVLIEKKQELENLVNRVAGAVSDSIEEGAGFTDGWHGGTEPIDPSNLH